MLDLYGPVLIFAALAAIFPLATLGLLVKQLAPSAADFPAISTVPGFTYRYNPQIDEFERSSASLGPVFVERAHTLGQGKFDLGFSYLFVDFDELKTRLDRYVMGDT